MLTERDLPARLVTAAAYVGDDDARAELAVATAMVIRRRRRRHGLLAAAAVVVAVGVVPVVTAHRQAGPAPTTAAIACEPGRTVVETPRVASLREGAVVTIANDTASTVVVHLGNETAVVPPGVAEGQYTLPAGRDTVQCVGDTPSPRASIAVLASRHA